MATVGGRSFDEDADGVRRKMDGVQPEAIREHYTEVNGVKYPPKQVLAVVTGWERTSYTTMEAQRVLGQIGFVSHRADASRAGVPSPLAAAVGPISLEPRVSSIEATLAVAQEAIAGLSRRVAALELAK